MSRFTARRSGSALGTSTPFAINATLHKNLPYDPGKDFAPIANCVSGVNLLCVNNDLPVKTIPELVAYAKSNPTKVNAATVGQGSALHLLGERLDALAGTSIPDIHYRGLGPALTDVMAGQVAGLEARGIASCAAKVARTDAGSAGYGAAPAVP